MTCATCYHERMTKVPDHVACALWSALKLGMRLHYHPRVPVSEKDYYANPSDMPFATYEDMFNSGLDINNAGTGWAYLQIHSDHVFNADKGFKPLFGEGVMTNTCILCHKDNHCIYWKERK